MESEQSPPMIPPLKNLSSLHLLNLLKSTGSELVGLLKRLPSHALFVQGILQRTFKGLHCFTHNYGLCCMSLWNRGNRGRVVWNGQSLSLNFLGDYRLGMEILHKTRTHTPLKIKENLTRTPQFHGMYRRRVVNV